MNNQLNNCLKKKSEMNDIGVKPEYKIYYMPSPFHGLNSEGQEFSNTAKFISHVNEKLFFAFVCFLFFFVGFIEIVLFFGIAIATIPREIFDHNEFLKIGMTLSIITLLLFTIDKIVTYSEKLHEESKEYKNRYI